MKILIKLVVVIVLIAAVAVGAAFYYVDAVAKSAIEREGTRALGVETTVSSTDVGILAGTFALAGLQVANPPGFDGDKFLDMGSGDVTVSFASLREETVRLPTLNLTNLTLNLERKSSGANYDAILANLKRLESGGATSPPSKKPGKKFIINEIVIRNIQVAVDLIPGGGQLTHVDVPIDEIRLKDVGSDSDTGVLMAELTSIILKAVFASVLKFGGALPAELLQDLSTELQKLEGLGTLGVDVLAGAGGQLQNVTGSLGAVVGDAQQQIDQTTKQAGDALEEVGKAAEDALKGIGDLFGGKKDK